MAEPNPPRSQEVLDECAARSLRGEHDPDCIGCRLQVLIKEAQKLERGSRMAFAFALVLASDLLLMSLAEEAE